MRKYGKIEIKINKTKISAIVDTCWYFYTMFKRKENKKYAIGKVGVVNIIY